MFEELGIGMGTFVIVTLILYYVIKAAVRNGINESKLIKKNLDHDNKSE